MLKGTTNPYRDLGHIKLYDPYAALEDTESYAFKKMLKTELAHFNTILKDTKKRSSAVIEDVFETLLEKALPRLSDAAQETLLFHGSTIYIQHSYSNLLNVWINNAEKTLNCFENLESFGTDTASNHYFIIKDVGDGDQTFQLDVYELDVKTPKYSISPVGPHAAFRGDYLYYESIQNRLRSNGIYRVIKNNGRHKMRVFNCADEKYQVELHAPPRQSDLFIRITNALSQRLAVLTGASYKWLTPPPPCDGNGETLLPVCKTIYASNNAFIHNGRTYNYPHKQFLADVAPLTENKILISLVKHAKVSLYIFDTITKTYHILYEAQEPNNIMLHMHSTVPSVTITSYYGPNNVYEIQDDTLVKVKTFPNPLVITKYSHGNAVAEDGTNIPYTFVSKVKKPKKLLVIAYGAYGLSSSRAYPKRWLPWLANGYAVVEAAPRGGRENGDAYYDAARSAARKKNTFDDSAAVIKVVQKRYHFNKENTAIYGRSAGGWTAAYIGLKYPNLVNAVYAEVPYLDVIRTSSNPALPLTQLEYDEFGNPRRSREEYDALLEISPIDIVTAAPLNAPFFLIRSALHDSQVYPYESLKFAAKMRSHGWNICVGMDTHGGHFVKRSSAAKIYAEDFLIIDAALHEKHKTRRQARNRLRVHKSNGITRRRSSSRKH